MIYFYWVKERRQKIEEKALKIWISLINNLGFKNYTKLVQEFGSVKALWNAKKEDILKVKGINEQLASNISNIHIKKDIKRHLDYLEKNNIDIISIDDFNYPTLLKQIYNPPLNLYLRGNKKILNDPCIAIIGCRTPSQYGINVAKNFAYNLSKNGFCIVSGLAHGIDVSAHIGTINAGEKTIAVLGNGLDTIYPQENKKIAQKILDSNGCIISEFPLGTKPQKMNFPARNRIVSGLCNAILVVEAKKKSGTLITVDFALEQGRDVFVIPGNIDSINSFGTNELIKQGAKLVTSWEEIITEYR